MGMFQSKKLEDWEEEILNSNNNNNTQHPVDVKKEHSAQASSYVYGHGGGSSGGGGVGGDDYQLMAQKQNWSPMIPASSPQSCVTSFSSNMLDFSNNNNNSLADHSRPRHPPQLDRSSEVSITNYKGFLVNYMC